MKTHSNRPLSQKENLNYINRLISPEPTRIPKKTPSNSNSQRKIFTTQSKHNQTHSHLLQSSPNPTPIYHLNQSVHNQCQTKDGR